MKSISFSRRDFHSMALKVFRPERFLLEGSVKSETRISIRSSKSSPLKMRSLESSLNISTECPKHQAAVKLQKIYKGFQTRRRLADCAVLIEQRWWKLLDFALLKLSSVSFFDIEKPETAVSRWSRARTRAAKVGKGLSKDEKAQKLALQHWLEAIDPRHRYGHNLQFYYDCWLQCESMEPFFYWLDVGEGKEVNLEEQCPRSRLQQQCVKYLGPKEREAYEVVIEDGKFFYKQSRQLLNTSDSPQDAKWIFVLSTSKNLYVGQKKKGKFQHSSFLAGGATSAAGQLVVEDGILKAVCSHSGHYRPTEENFEEFMSFLVENKVDLADVKKGVAGEDHEFNHELQKSNSGLKLSEIEISTEHETEANEKTLSSDAAAQRSSFEAFKEENCPLADLKPCGKEKDDEEVGSWKELDRTCTDGGEESAVSENPSSSETNYIFVKKNLFSKEQEEDAGAIVPSELILRRIKSKNRIESYQLGKQLSFRWISGAGPRIGCVRDYPPELRFQALEQVNLSPRSDGVSRFTSPRKSNSPRAKEAS
ncbi:IQ domain-containing protein IQM2-like [Zingiber officinale]|nr:IQ domain-containing protein IQM2-like [Zingiber officinale]